MLCNVVFSSQPFRVHEGIEPPAGMPIKGGLRPATLRDYSLTVLPSGIEKRRRRLRAAKPFALSAGFEPARGPRDHPRLFLAVLVYHSDTTAFTFSHFGVLQHRE